MKVVIIKLRITLTMVIIFMMAGCVNKEDDKKELNILDIKRSNVVNSDEAKNDNESIKRVEVARMLGLTFANDGEINDIEREITYKDVDYSKEESIYITLVSNLKIMSGDNEEFRGDDNLTTKEAVYLLEKINEKNKYNIYIDEKNANNPISRELWTELFIKTLEDMSEGENLYKKYNLEKENIIILATNNKNKKIPENYVITNKGSRKVGVIDLTKYIDNELEVIAKNGKIIGVMNILTVEPTIKNAYIVSNTSTSIIIFSGGVEREYVLISGIEENYSGSICDINIKEGIVSRLTIYEESYVDKVMKYNKNIMELQNKGNMELEEDYEVYYINNDMMSYKGFNDVVVGYGDVRHFIKDGKIIASVVFGEIEPKNIRVLIKDTAFKNEIHEEVELEVDGDYKIIYGDEEESHKKGHIFKIGIEDKNKYGEKRIYVLPEDKNSRIKINSIKRNYTDNKSPEYRGIIELQYRDKSIVIVNELDLEEYLYAIIPSEMPMSFGLEALKVQSITARSYAYNQIFRNRFKEYGANVDDSVISQVYNNIEEQTLGVEAVDKTKGIYLESEGKVISANFYSTSSGNSANSGDVWFNTKNKKFPTSTKEYLKSNKLYEGKDYGDLKEESNMRNYILDQNIESYDAHSRWFRWDVTMTSEEIRDSINKSINSRYKANQHMFKFTNKEGNKIEVDDNIEVKNIINIEILDRGDGGIIRKLLISDEEKDIEIKGEYNIRLLLAPKKADDSKKDIVLNRKGDTLKNYSLLPSGFFIIDEETVGDGKVKFKISGGGNGHGVGMSQNGVKQMAMEGKKYEEILKYYYKGVDIRTTM